MIDEQTDERQDAKKASKKADKRDAMHKLNVEWVMNDARGRAFVWWLLGETGVARTSFSTNALTMAHFEGKRAVGLMLTSEIMEVNANTYLTMQREANNQEIENER